MKTIQEFNRKAIIMACNPEAKSYEKALAEEQMAYHINTGSCTGDVFTMTLDRVLIALKQRFEGNYHKMIFQNDELLFICAESPVCQFYWNLAKQVLEEQSEKTQRAIFNLLGGSDAE